MILDVREYKKRMRSCILSYYTSSLVAQRFFSNDFSLWRQNSEKRKLLKVCTQRKDAATKWLGPYMEQV